MKVIIVTFAFIWKLTVFALTRKTYRLRNFQRLKNKRLTNKSLSFIMLTKRYGMKTITPASALVRYTVLGFFFTLCFTACLGDPDPRIIIVKSIRDAERKLAAHTFTGAAPVTPWFWKLTNKNKKVENCICCVYNHILRRFLWKKYISF